MDKGQRTARRDRLVKERRHDTFAEKSKLPEPTVCTRCGAVYSSGRWTWSEAPAGADKITCPACQRTIEDYPAGSITIQGDFFKEHRDEILNLIRNEEDSEKTAHPMERIMAVTDQEDRTVVTTTGVHLAGRLGKALARAYQGELSLEYGEGEKSVRVSWTR